LDTGRKIDLHLPWSYAATFSADSKMFALSGGSNVRLFETATTKQVVQLDGILGQVWGVGFSPDAKRFMTGDGGKESVTLWDTVSREKVLILETQASFFEGIAFSPDGNILAACNQRGVLHFWRAPTWAEIEAKETKSRRDDRK
jgi:WD40 repeat protein